MGLETRKKALCPAYVHKDPDPPRPSGPALVEADFVLLNCSLPEHGRMSHTGKVLHLKGKRGKSMPSVQSLSHV